MNLNFTKQEIKVNLLNYKSIFESYVRLLDESLKIYDEKISIEETNTYHEDFFKEVQKSYESLEKLASCIKTDKEVLKVLNSIDTSM